MTTAYANNEVVSDDENDTACECGHCGRNQTAPQYTTDAIISASEAIARLRDADAIIIGAGAGASIDAGINYADKAKFKRLYPGLVERGVAENFWEMIGYHGDLATSWAYLAQHALEMTRHQPHPTYAALRRAVGDKPHFILTSNVDGHFLHHFDREALLTAQGDFAKLQCGSCRTVWPMHVQDVELELAVVLEAHVAPRALDRQRLVGRQRLAVGDLGNRVPLVASEDAVAALLPRLLEVARPRLSTREYHFMQPNAQRKRILVWRA
jgi:hypothetical protein